MHTKGKHIVCCIGAVVALGGSALAGPDVPATQLRVDPILWEQLTDRHSQPVVIDGVSLPGVDAPVTLQLEPFTPVTATTRFVVGSVRGPDRDFAFDTTMVQSYRGWVADMPGSHVFLTISPYQVQGTIDLGTSAGIMTGSVFGVSNKTVDGGFGDMGVLTVFTPTGGQTGGVGIASCGTVTDPEAAMHQADHLAKRAINRVSGITTDGTNIHDLRQVEVAVETDFEYYSLFDDLNAAGAYVLQTYAAISDIYIRDVNTRVDVSYVRLWDDPNDLFNEQEPLDPFRQYWNANMGGVHRDVAQFFTGRRNLTAGGVAYLNGLCNNNSYSWSGYIVGSFVDPTTPNIFQRDVTVTAHELGHNCGTAHTHDYGLDTCDNGATPATRGTIMAYCSQTFTGGSGNNDARFHAFTQAIMEDYITSRTCVITDCNQNGIDDLMDITVGTSLDVNGNGVCDECEDCNGNGVLDPQDIANGTSTDLNANGIPDDCEPDCNGNSIPDDLDLVTSFGTPVFFDTFNTDTGWVLENLGATSGDWERAIPVNDPNWQHDPESDADGSGWCLVTDNAPGNSDVDNGATRITSPQLDFSAGGLGVFYNYFQKLGNNGGPDIITVEMSDSGLAGPWVQIAAHGQNNGLAWTAHFVTPQELASAGLTPTSDSYVRFTIVDANPQSVVEGGIDTFAVVPVFPAISVDLDNNNVPDECQPDANNNGVVDWYDIATDMSLDLNRNILFDVYEDCDNNSVPDLTQLDGAGSIWIGHHDASGTLKRYLGGTGTQETQTQDNVVLLPNDVLIDQMSGLVNVTSADDRIVQLYRFGGVARDLVTAGAGGLSNPGMMMFHDGGTLLVTSTGTNSVKMYDANSGGYIGDFSAANAPLELPFGIAKGPNNNVFVTSQDVNNAGRVIELHGQTGAYIRDFVQAGDNGGLSTPRGMLFHPDTGNLLVCSFDTDQVLEYDATTGAFVGQWHNGGTFEPNRLWLDNPWAIRVGPDGNIYVSRHNEDESAGSPGGELHLTDAAVYIYQRTKGHLLRAYIQGQNAGLHHPSGFDFLPRAGIDCNYNQVLDTCDIASGYSQDVNNNGIPDECEDACYADCDSNGVLNIFDYICFGNAYATQSPSADCDSNGLFNIFDYICFGNAYAAGCP
ncbi:MAG: hypothetical protein H6815_03030 [Phycisphaeraceae bacterium]|nr:hypothetical protein [Phycisphaerales bacterium]MCB9859401.1 hypothetical protein [Phycisphaeraceae bacterium]